MIFAPILVLVYNRPNHFISCIESLKINHNAQNTVLYIASDGPKDEGSKILVDQVRDYIKTIHGFKEVIVFAPKLNTAKKIFIDTLDIIRETYDRYIITEDDNLYSKHFINFINDGLAKFEGNPNVHAICGHNYLGFPAEDSKVIALKCFSPWGYGVWRDRDIHYQTEQIELIEDVFKSKELFKKLNYGIPHIIPMLRSIIKKELYAGDVPQCVLLFKTNAVCIFPSYSLVRNIGHDGSGEHCGINKAYNNQPIFDKKIDFNNLKNIKPDALHNIWLHKNFGGKYRELANWFIYYELNTQSLILKKLNQISYKSYHLPRRIAGYLYRRISNIIR
jgi:hypothetical protein